MAKITLEYASEMLARNVTLTALIPEQLQESKVVPCLYLLHGLSGHHTDWTNHTRIQKWANEKQIAVIMPSADNKFYLDNPNTHEYYSRFVGEELIKVTRNMFPLSSLRENTYIGGLSMGGYGALINGYKYYQTFGTIIALSSALIIDEIPHKQGGTDGPLLDNRYFFESIFGDLNKVVGSDKDYRILLEKIPKDLLPKIYLSCGSDDFFIEHNRNYSAMLETLNIPHEYIEIQGDHDWNTWDAMIKMILELI